MKIYQALLALLAIITTIHAFTLPAQLVSVADYSRELFKRRGGGRGGGFSSGSRGSGSSTSARTARLGSSDSNVGGKTPSGTGIQPHVYPGGSSFYFGGAGVPYRAGTPSPRGIRPTFLPAGVFFFPGIWLYGAYAYHYPNPYRYHNDTSDMNMTKPVDCLCAQYQTCGCNQVKDNETAYINNVANDNSKAVLANVSGVETLVLNGTLPNGTTAASAGFSFKQGLREMSGWWVVIAGVLYTVWLF